MGRSGSGLPGLRYRATARAQMAQPTGPQEAPDGAPPSPPPLGDEVRDMRRETLRPRQAGQATSASSERRMISSSKALPQASQAYS